MSGFGKTTVGFVFIVFAISSPIKACHETIHYTKAEIDTANVRLYKRDVSERARNLSGFDQKHRLIGEVLGNQQFYAQELGAWKAHPGRFEREHHRLWRVVDGDMLYHKKHPYEISIPSIPPGALPPGRPGGGLPMPPDPPGGGNPGFPVHPAAVPEPASGLLALTALVVGLFTAIRHTRTKLPTSPAIVRHEVL